MASWKKKIEKSVGHDLSGETLVEGVLLQPSGLVRQMVAKEVGGLAGVAIAGRLAGSGDAPPEGAADGFPDGPIVVGLTDRRVLAWSWAKLTGKPKQLLVAVPREAIAEVSAEKQAATYRFTVTFADGSSRVYEAPKLGNPVEEFAAAFARR